MQLEGQAMVSFVVFATADGPKYWPVDSQGWFITLQPLRVPNFAAWLLNYQRPRVSPETWSFMLPTLPPVVTGNMMLHKWSSEVNDESTSARLYL